MVSWYIMYSIKEGLNCISLLFATKWTILIFSDLLGLLVLFVRKSCVWSTSQLSECCTQINSRKCILNRQHSIIQIYGKTKNCPHFRLWFWWRSILSKSNLGNQTFHLILIISSHIGAKSQRQIRVWKNLKTTKRNWNKFTKKCARSLEL